MLGVGQRCESGRPGAVSRPVACAHALAPARPFQHHLLACLPTLLHLRRWPPPPAPCASCAWPRRWRPRARPSQPPSSPLVRTAPPAPLQQLVAGKAAAVKMQPLEWVVRGGQLWDPWKQMQGRAPCPGAFRHRQGLGWCAGACTRPSLCLQPKGQGQGQVASGVQELPAQGRKRMQGAHQARVPAPPRPRHA